jgi:TonB family protein
MRVVAFTIVASFVMPCFAGTPAVPKDHRFVYAPKPAYPMEARAHHWTGTCLLILTVDQKTGWVVGVRVVKSTGHPILDNAAIAAFSRWRFKGGKVAKEVKVPITFTM